MKLAVTTLASALSSVTLLALLAVPQQNAPAKPQNAPKPKPTPPAAKPAEPPAKSEPPPAAASGDPAAQAADPSAKPAGPDADTALANRYLRAAEIGDEHKWLGNLQGKWKTLTTQRIKPDAPPVESTGTSEFQLFMDGRFLLENNKSGGSAGNSQGMGIIGFNNMTKKYERVWFDTHSTAMLKSEGTYDKSHDEILWTDQWCDPTTGQIVTTQSALRRNSDKDYIFTQTETLPTKAVFLTLKVQYKKAE